MDQALDNERYAPANSRTSRVVEKLDALDCDPSDETIAVYEKLTGRCRR